jgi:hypothetical protein
MRQEHKVALCLVLMAAVSVGALIWVFNKILTMDSAAQRAIFDTRSYNGHSYIIISQGDGMSPCGITHNPECCLGKSYKTELLGSNDDNK